MFKSGNTTVMVSDFSKAVHFYVDTLGLNLQSQIEGHLAQVETPGLTIWLIHMNGEEEQRGKSGNISIGFEVEDLDSTVELLKSRGVEFENFLDSENTRFAYFSDPDSTPLYLIELKVKPDTRDRQ